MNSNVTIKTFANELSFHTRRCYLTGEESVTKQTSELAPSEWNEMTHDTFTCIKCDGKHKLLDFKSSSKTLFSIPWNHNIHSCGVNSMAAIQYSYCFECIVPFEQKRTIYIEWLLSFPFNRRRRIFNKRRSVIARIGSICVFQQQFVLNWELTRREKPNANMRRI